MKLPATSANRRLRIAKSDRGRRTVRVRTVRTGSSRTGGSRETDDLGSEGLPAATILPVRAVRLRARGPRPRLLFPDGIEVARAPSRPDGDKGGPNPQRPRGHSNRDSGGRPVLRMGVSPGGFHGARILPCCGWLPSSLAGGVVLHRDFDRRGAPLGRPLIRSRKAPSGSFAFTTPVARSTPDVPSSIAFATSLRVCTPAPHRTTIFGFTARIRSTARETTSGFAVVTLTSPPINSGGSIAIYSGERFARVSASAMSSAQATTSRPSF